MSEHDDPVRWVDAPDRAPPRAAELVRSIGAPPPLPPDLSALVIRRARPRPWRRWVGPSLAAAVIVGGLVLWRFSAREPEPAMIAQDEPAAATIEASAPNVAPERPRASEAIDPPPEPSDARPVRVEPAARAPQTGWLTVTSTPWTRVYVDGRDTGRHTPIVDMPLPPGPHVIELRTTAGTSMQSTVEIRAGERTRLVRRFDVPDAVDRPASRPVRTPEIPLPAPQADPAGYGYLMVRTLPWARVFVDGRDTGRNTPIHDLRVPAGRHTIGLRTHDGTMHTIQVHFEPGETTRIVRQLGPSRPVRFDEDE